MRVSANKISENGLTFNKDYVIREINQNQNKLFNSGYDLYCNYFSSSPSELNRSDFLKELREEFPDDFNYLIKCNTGEVDLSASRLFYAYAKSSNSEFKKIISLYRDYRIASSNLQALYDMVNKGVVRLSRSETSRYKVRVSVTPNEGVVYNKKYLNSNLIPRLLNRTPNTKLISLDTRVFLLIELAKEVGVSDLDITCHRMNNTSLFVDGISFIEELDLFSDLCSGAIIADKIKDKGGFAELLIKYLEDYRTKTAGTIASVVGFISIAQTISTKVIDDRCNFVNDLRKEFISRNPREFYLTSSEVYFEIDKRSYDNEDVIGDSFIEPVRCSNVAFDTETMTELPKYNNLMGIGGELISEQQVNQLGYSVNGLPVKVHFYERTSSNRLADYTENYYLISDVTYSDERNSSGELITKSIIPVLGTNLPVNDISSKELQQRFGVYKDDDIQLVIRDNLKLSFYPSDMDVEEYKDLVSTLVAMLVYLDAGRIHYIPREKFSNVSDENYKQGLYDADIEFRRISSMF